MQYIFDHDLMRGQLASRQQPHGAFEALRRSPSPPPFASSHPTQPRFVRLGVDTSADGHANTFDPSQNVQVHASRFAAAPAPAPPEKPAAQPRRLLSHLLGHSTQRDLLHRLLLLL